MQKNKIDVVKAVCNSAARKLAVLSLAVAVSSSAVASAQTDPRQRWNCGKSVKEVMLEEIARREGNSTTIERLDAINRETYVLSPVVDDVVAQCYSLMYELENNALDESEREDLQAQLEEVEAERERVVNQQCLLERERRDLLEPFSDRLSVPDNLCVSLMFNIENEACDAGFVAEEPGRGNFVYNCLSNLGFREDAIQNIMRFFGYDHPSQTQQSTISLPTLPPILPLQQQQGQQPQRSGISFNLFNWGLFGGKK